MKQKNSEFVNYLYKLRLVGVYNIPNSASSIAVMQSVFNKNYLRIYLKDIINNKKLLCNINPLQAFYIALIVNLENNQRQSIEISSLIFGQSRLCKKTEVKIKIIKQEFDLISKQTFVYFSDVNNSVIKIIPLDVVKNPGLIFGLSSIDAATLACCVSEDILRRE